MSTDLPSLWAPDEGLGASIRVSSLREDGGDRRGRTIDRRGRSSIVCGNVDVGTARVRYITVRHSRDDIRQKFSRTRGR